MFDLSEDRLITSPPSRLQITLKIALGIIIMIIMVNIVIMVNKVNIDHHSQY